MAVVSVPHATYDQFRNATLGHAYDVDGVPPNQPYQCYDYVDLLYEQSDVGQWLSTANTGSVKYCWLNTTARANNGSGHFQAISGVTNIKRGDIIVFDTYSGWYGSTGHIGFADEDYNGTNMIKLVSQNFYGYHYVVREDAYLGSAFLGIFRYKPWHTTPPTPTPTQGVKKKEFPWPVAWQHWRNFKRK